MHLESVFRWRLSNVKVSLELGCSDIIINCDIIMKHLKTHYAFIFKKEFGFLYNLLIYFIKVALNKRIVVKTTVKFK